MRHFAPYSALAAVLLSACATATPAPSRGADTGPMSAGASAPRGAWIDLHDPAAWRGYRARVLPAGWSFDSTTRILTRVAGGGDIITRARFSDFELELEWKVGPRGNSGIFYWATEGTTRIYENSPEMQILDNTGHGDGRNSLTAAGANYALHAPARDVTRRVGEWNAARLLVRGDTVTQFLNGVQVVRYVAGTDDWKAKVKASKFSAWPTYGLARVGHIGLQDHGDVVQFRAMRVRELVP